MTWVNTSPLVKTYTLEEFWELPEPPDHSKIELIAGVLYMTPPPETPHNEAASRLNLLLSQHLIEMGNGKLYFPRTGISITPNTWLEPDLFYISAETRASITGRYLTTADLVIEIISPGSAIYDRNTKADTYAVLGIKELWLVDEFEGLVEVRVLKGDSYESHVFEREDDLISTVLPGFSFKVGEIFGD